MSNLILPSLTDSQIKAAYEANADTNAFDDGEQTKLAGVEAGATADQTNSQIKSAYEANADTNAFDDGEQTKLAGVEAGATADQTKADIDALGINAATVDQLSQTWQDVTGSRVTGTTYQNTSGAPIMLSVGMTGGQAVAAEIRILLEMASTTAVVPVMKDSIIFYDTLGSNDYLRYEPKIAGVVVPDGWYYKVTSLNAGSVSKWWELR